MISSKKEKFLMKTVGVDIGTMNIVSCYMLEENDKMQIDKMRNMFLPVSTDILQTNELTDTQIDYVIQKDDGGNDQVFIIGDDAFKFAQIFGSEIKRPMNKGVISVGEIDAIDVLTVMIKRLIGQTKDGCAIYSVPASAIDIEIPPVLYHEKVFNKVFKTLGFQSKPINEALAIIYAECRSSNFTGISLSFGAGLTNVCCAYKGQQIITFSVSRGGDWIDQNVASSVGVVESRVTNVKERDLDLTNPKIGKKKEKRVREALVFYYEDLIEYVLKHFVQQFNKATDSLNIDDEIPIIVSGGTSKPKNFVELFRKVFNEGKEFPYDISEIRQAENPLLSVSKGCLIYGLWNNTKEKKLNSQKKDAPKTKSKEPEK